MTLIFVCNCTPKRMHDEIDWRIQRDMFVYASPKRKKNKSFEREWILDQKIIIIDVLFLPPFSSRPHLFCKRCWYGMKRNAVQRYTIHIYTICATHSAGMGRFLILQGVCMHKNNTLARAHVNCCRLKVFPISNMRNKVCNTYTCSNT